ncbi:MAG: hypothetical protein KDA57_01820 [Planctomycetales bacterium]|nr:hypothetical protein [Planctomycetales bacterium]
MRFSIRVACLFLIVAGGNGAAAEPACELQCQVEVEEEVYTYQPADNGAGPMWCFGNTSIVRVGDDVFASRLATIAERKPLNNCAASLLRRTDAGWSEVHRAPGLTREPSPLVAIGKERVFLSVNPTLTAVDTYSGPAQPGVLEFSLAALDEPPRELAPTWEGQPEFREHSYRSFVADGENGELLLLQNIGYTHAEWSYCDREGNWSAYGKLKWPWGGDYAEPKPIRVCYPAVALKDRQVFFCGVSDIVEPNPAWRSYKKELTGREWDYDFRRLFFCWSDDIATGVFHDWVEVSSREATAGWISPNDLYVAPNGDVLVLWSEKALDERLREKYFPEAKQRHSLECAVLRNGRVVRQSTLAEGGDELGGLSPGRGRFHVAENGQLCVIYYVGGTDEKGQALAENRIVALGLDGEVGEAISVALEQPLSSFFTATVRAGCQPSDTLDLLGSVGTSMRYARIRLAVSSQR